MGKISNAIITDTVIVNNFLVQVNINENVRIGQSKYKASNIVTLYCNIELINHNKNLLSPAVMLSKVQASASE